MLTAKERCGNWRNDMSTPLEISIAVHYYTRGGDYGRGTGDNNWTAPAVQDACEAMCAWGLLRRSEKQGQMYEATKGMDAFMQAMCDIPWPVQQWVIPD